MFSNYPNWGQTSQNQRVVATNATSRVTIYEEVQYGIRTLEYQVADRFYKKIPYSRRVSEYQDVYKFYEEVPYNRRISEVLYGRRTSKYQGADRFYEEVPYGKRTPEYQGTHRFCEEVPYNRRSSEYQGVDRTKDQRQLVAYAFNNGIFIPNQPSGIGPSAQLNFPISNHAKELGAMAQMTDQYVANFNRSRNSFVRGKSRFRGVARHDATGKWQAWTATGERILGIFETEEEAAIAYDLACIKQKGYQAITNYDKRHYDVNAMLNSNKPKLQGMEVGTTWLVTAQEQAYPHRINTNNAGWSNNIQPTICRVRGFRPAGEGVTNFVEILGLEKQDNGSGSRFRHGDFSAFNMYKGMQQIRKPAVRNAGFGIGHATASAFQSYKQTETGNHQRSSFASVLPQNPWLFPPYSINFEREQWLKAAGLGFKHSNPSHFKVYERNTMRKGKVKVNC